ncbi:ester cyclase [Glutamicibacter sp.]|uniref:ester cyclase n=1 Tax=Glutamicibacter sp. TaxID=1931995 RepID=UPI0028BE1A21|nr:ester cyclase [Glutamicibacter sp.]
MSEMLEKVTSAWTRAWSQGETKAFEELVSEDYRRQSKSGHEGLAQVVSQIEDSHRAFSDFTMEILRSVEGENEVAIHWRSVGRHTGEFMGVPPTGREVIVSGASFIRFADGKITEEDVIWDPREMLSAMSIWHLGDTRRRK